MVTTSVLGILLWVSNILLSDPFSHSAVLSMCVSRSCSPGSQLPSAAVQMEAETLKPENSTNFIHEIMYHLFPPQAASPSELVILPVQSSPDERGANASDRPSQSSSNKGSNSRWSTLSWDVPSDLLSPSTPDSGGTNHLDSDSRPSSGMHTNPPCCPPPPTGDCCLQH